MPGQKLFEFQRIVAVFQPAFIGEIHVFLGHRKPVRIKKLVLLVDQNLVKHVPERGAGDRILASVAFVKFMRAFGKLNPAQLNLQSAVDAKQILRADKQIEKPRISLRQPFAFEIEIMRMADPREKESVQLHRGRFGVECIAVERPRFA